LFLKLLWGEIEKQGKKRIAVQPRDPAHRDSAGHFARRRATMIRNRSQILGSPSISASSPNHFVYLMGEKSTFTLLAAWN
jgi:hypothetical protein